MILLVAGSLFEVNPVANERGADKTRPPPRAHASSKAQAQVPSRAQAQARTNPHRVEADPYIGKLIDGRFEIQAIVGRGGMGQVYRARQRPLGREVALKVMAQSQKPERAEEFQRRFFLEASTSAKLSHPNTITIFDYGSDEVEGETIFFIAMELVEGVTLSRALRGGPFRPARAVNIGLQMCRSLREAHRAQVVHRDLKPGNIMLTRPDGGEEKGSESDFVKVLDFGLAKSFTDDAEGLTRAGTFLGSPRYVAPEQIEGKLVDPRADIYAFGVVFFRMLSGRVPFDGTQPVEIMMKHLHDDVPSLPAQSEHGEIPRALADLVYDCLRKKPDNRPQSMGEVITRLKLVRGDLGMRDERQSLSDELSEAAKRSPSINEPAREGPRNTDDELRATAAPPADISDPSGKAIESGEIVAQRNVTKGREQHPDAASATEEEGHAATTTPVQMSNALDSEILDNTRPTRVLGKLTTEKGRPKKRMFVAGLLFGAFIAGVLLVALSLQVFGPSRVPVVTSSPEFAVEVRVVTTPPAAVFLVDGSERERLGISPLTLHWKMSADEQPRSLRFERDGYRPAVARVFAPTSSTVLEVATTLVKTTQRVD